MIEKVWENQWTLVNGEREVSKSYKLDASVFFLILQSPLNTFHVTFMFTLKEAKFAHNITRAFLLSTLNELLSRENS